MRRHSRGVVRGAAPEVDRRVGAPRPPSFGPLAQGRGRERAALAGRFQKHEIASPETHPVAAERASRRIRPSTRRCPARERGFPAKFVGFPEANAAGDDRLGEGADRVGPGARQARRRVRARTSADGNTTVRPPESGSERGSPSRRARRPARVDAPFTVTCCPRMARTASSNGSHAPGTRSPGCRFDEAPQLRIPAKVLSDRRCVGSDVEHRANSRDDRRERAGLGESDSHLETTPPLLVPDLEHAVLAVEREGSPVRTRDDFFDARNRPAFEKREEAIPVVGRPVRKTTGSIRPAG